MVIDRKTVPRLPPGWKSQDAIDQIVRRTHHFVPSADYERVFDFCLPVYTRQLTVGPDAHGASLRADSVLYHPGGDPPDLIIEGAPYNPTHARLVILMSNIKNHYPFQTIIVFDPKAYSPHAQEWLRIQTDDRLIHVFDIEEFSEWAHRTWEERS